MLFFMALRSSFDGGPTKFRWRIRALSLWLLILSGWMLTSLLIGHSNTGEWQTWALVNKTVGWFALLAYLWVGGWFGASLDVHAGDSHPKE